MLTWKNWVGKDYVVSAATGNEIAVNNRVSFGTADVKVGVNADPAKKDADQTQTITVYSQSLTPTPLTLAPRPTPSLSPMRLPGMRPC